jgi:hypothetical protein
MFLIGAEQMPYRSVILKYTENFRNTRSGKLSQYSEYSVGCEIDSQREQKLFSSVQRQDWLWCPRSVWSNGYRSQLPLSYREWDVIIPTRFHVVPNIMKDWTYDPKRRQVAIAGSSASHFPSILKLGWSPLKFQRKTVSTVIVFGHFVSAHCDPLL